ncbi:MAG: fructosamine kinase family protein [Gammaproteobacteria bacterium]
MAALPGDTLWLAVAAQLTAVTGVTFATYRAQPLGGGCINAAYRLEDGRRRYFVKINTAARASMFEAEADGLREIARSATVRVPKPICTGVHGSSSYLVLEALELAAGSSRLALEHLARQLAAMHRTPCPRFGWHRDNTIGSTPQPNAVSDDWVAFWRERRLGFQLELAARNGHGGRLQSRGQRLMAGLPAFFQGHRPVPALLHGDLWGGNYGMTDAGEPVIFDPATYHGDREADLAMTELFGGFGERFHHAYGEVFPVDPGYPTRRVLYNLYHVLNHLNLFGGGYRAQAEQMIDLLLAELG